MSKRMKRIYIAGPITNNPDYVKQFREAEQMLKKKGFRVLNPIHNTGDSYKELIDKGLAMLMICDAIYMLPGWEESKGATLEIAYAETVGIEIIYAQEEAN